MDYKAVIFDFDYTLGDATEAIFAGFTHAFSVMGYAPPDREAVRRTVGLLLEDAYTQLTGDSSDQGRADFRTHFTSMAHPMQVTSTQLCQGAEELLRALQGAGVPTAIVSTKHTRTLEAIFDHHGIRNLTTSIIGGDQVERPKPDPQGLNAAVARLELSPGEVLYCGDTLIDGNTAKAAGTDFCAVLNGTTTAEAFAGLPHVFIAPTLPDLRRFLGL